MKHFQPRRLGALERFASPPLSKAYAGMCNSSHCGGEHAPSGLHAHCEWVVTCKQLHDVHEEVGTCAGDRGRPCCGGL